jgi:hypothetical protein
MERINKESIREVLDGAKYGLYVDDIATQLVNKFSDVFSEKEPLEFEKVKSKSNGILLSETKKPNGIFTKVKNPKTNKYKKGIYKLKQNKGVQLPIVGNPDPKPTPPPPLEPDTKLGNINLFVGKAGECAVMSELLFRGYNVNSMLVDDGVDIVASKNNMFYYLQVKTTIVIKNKIYATIRQKKFNDYIGTQIRYVVVARCKLNKVETNLYFVFDNRKIQELIFGKKINSNEDRIYIKIEIDQKDNKPYIYDEKQECVEFYMNNFEL